MNCKTLVPEAWSLSLHERVAVSKEALRICTHHTLGTRCELSVCVCTYCALPVVG